MKVDLTSIPVIYINLDRDVEKRCSMESMLYRNGFTKIYRSPGVIVENQPVCVGISHAFKNAFDLAFDVSDGLFLMLEDDVIPRSCFTTTVSVPDDFDAVYLGVSTWGISYGVSGEFARASKTDMDGILKIHNMLSGHAILYRDGEYARTVHARMDKAIKSRTYQDIEFANTMDQYKVYAFSDPLVYQTSTIPIETTNLNFGDFLRANNRLR